MELDLSHNGIGDHGVQKVGFLMSPAVKTVFLNNLNLSNNNISSIGLI